MRAGPFQLLALADIKGMRPGRGDDADARLLVESLKRIGVLHAPVVVADGNGYRLIAGAGRCGAAKQAGIEKLWCYVLPHAADSPEARLAFFDENLLRVEVPPAMRDEQWAARRKLIEQIDPTQKPEAKKAAAGDRGKEGGRGKKKTHSRKPGKGKSPSKESDAREQAEAAHRVEGAAPGTWQLYADGKLKQSQVDKIITIVDPARQQVVAAECVGKSVGQTIVLVQAARSDTDAPTKRLRAVTDALEAVTRRAKELASAVVRCEAAIDLLDDFSTSGTHFQCSTLAIAVDACQRLIARLTSDGGGRGRSHEYRQLNG